MYYTSKKLFSYVENIQKIAKLMIFFISLFVDHIKYLSTKLIKNCHLLISIKT